MDWKHCCQVIAQDNDTEKQVLCVLTGSLRSYINDPSIMVHNECPHASGTMGTDPFQND